MGYATQQDLVDRYGIAELVELTDRDGTGEPDAAPIGDALADADQEIDGYLLRRYTLPLSPAPAILVRVACCLARLTLAKDGARDVAKDDAAWARRWLRDVADGKVALAAAGAEPPVNGGGSAEIAGPDRTFDRDSLRGW